MIPARSMPLATSVGLFVALAGPPVAFLAGYAVFGAEDSLPRVEAGLAVHWLNFAALIAVVTCFERRPLASIGVQPMRWWTAPAGLGAGAAIVVLSGVLVSALGLNATAPFATYLLSLPFLTRSLLAITAGVFEETLYRGYAVERLTTLWGNKWIAGLVTVVLFTLAHLPGAGWNNLLPIGIVSVLVTMLYLWRRDLILNIIAHATIDAIGLLLQPVVREGGH